MSRYLFVVPPLAGHVNPTLAIGHELAARGHAVAWTGPDEVVGPLLPRDATFLPTPLAAAVREAIAARADDLRGVVALRHLVGDFLVPLAECMVPGVRAAVDSFAPDALVVDQQALAGLAVACTSGLPWATSATTSANLDDPLAAVPKIKAWADGLQRDVLRSAGVDEASAATVDLRSSPHLLLVFSTPALVGGAHTADHVAFVGPSIAARPAEAPFDLGWFDHQGPHVLVSLGTLNWHNGGRFFAAAAEALGDLGARGVIAAPPEVVGPVPAGLVATAPVPQLGLMPYLDAVVCHGGHNTVCEALAHGLPLVVAPVRDDQPAIAEQVVRAGAGVRVMFRRVTPAALREAIAAALDDPGLRAGARRIQRSFAEAGGASAAADRLERLPARPGAAIHPAEV
ncbi:MAG TPA: nucleotide disphospho-sugar-binding domain-containing protein [Acidimicrobiales bacterium]|nr:nucleotide disphospho-sugar-binding domain-containing protein [Acidimicrobiales bacterium]